MINISGPLVKKIKNKNSKNFFLKKIKIGNLRKIKKNIPKKKY